MVTFGQGVSQPKVGATGPAGSNPFGMAGGDINGDGLTDLFVANWGSTSTVFYGDGQGNFTATPISSLGQGQVPLFGDIDGDGRPDLGLFDDHGAFRYAIQDASGGFSRTFSPVLTVPSNQDTAAFLRDVNGDFRPDLVFLDLDLGSNKDLFVALNTGSSNGWFTPDQLTSWAPSPRGSAIPPWGQATSTATASSTSSSWPATTGWWRASAMPRQSRRRRSPCRCSPRRIRPASTSSTPRFPGASTTC
ncbi:MAG: VCBS repeat-containing protein [Singulisphaera sp.]